MKGDADLRFAELVSQRFPQLIVTSKLGKGAQGIVFKCYNSSIDKFVVVKLNTDHDCTPERTEQIFKFMKKASQENLKGIIKCYDCDFYELNGLLFSYIVMEMGNPLDNVISTLHKSKVTPLFTSNNMVQILEYFSQILEGVMTLHNENFTHRDLKLPNCVIAENGIVKLIDFDNTKIIQSTKSITFNIGTWEYLAPEVYDEEESGSIENLNISKYCDIYSLGCVLLKMITNKFLSVNPDFISNKPCSNQDIIGVGKNYFFKYVTSFK